MLTLPSKQRDERAPTFTSTKEYYIYNIKKHNNSIQILIDTLNTNISPAPGWVSRRTYLKFVLPLPKKVTGKNIENGKKLDH